MDSRLAIYGDSAYREYVETGRVLLEFLNKESKTSEDLFAASFHSGYGMSTDLKDLHSSTLNRMSDVLIQTYRIPDNKLERVYTALEESHVLDTCAHEAYKPQKQEPNAKFRLSAARKLLATSLATESNVELSVARWALVGVYRTAWNTERDDAIKCADQDLERIHSKLTELATSSNRADDKDWTASLGERTGQGRLQ